MIANDVCWIAERLKYCKHTTLQIYGTLRENLTSHRISSVKKYLFGKKIFIIIENT